LFYLAALAFAGGLPHASSLWTSAWAGPQNAATASKAAAADGQNLDAVLRGMDQAAASFRSVTGNLEYTKVTVVVNDRATDKGKIYFQRDKGKTQVMLAFQQPNEKYVLFSGDKVSMYLPKIAE